MSNQAISTIDTNEENVIVTHKNPLVTVVIPCYNHGHFLGEAIESILAQSYNNIEIIIINDGSIDNSEEVACNYKEVIYIKQENQGLSAARNTGLMKSKGEFIVFLDADDLLQPEAMETNTNYLRNNSSCAFVSGNYKRVANDGMELSPPKVSKVFSNHYEAFLKGNYIGMHATVMYNKKILLQEGGFNPQLKACEDYDLYLRLSRKYSIYSHQQILASYRRHDSNMSSNISLMLKNALAVLTAQLPHLDKRPDLIKAYKIGVTGWKEYYTRQFIKEVKGKKKIWKPMKRSERLFLVRNMSFPCVKFMYKTIRTRMIKPILGKLLPGNIVAKNKYYTPAIGKVKWGDFRRLNPISRNYGYERGGPIDRYYIENFLARNSNVIKGRVLEIGDNEYTLRYGKENVIKSDILHLHDDNPNATFVGDLTDAEHVPSNAFDCVVLTQTLHLIYNYKKALKTCYRLLKPGGTLLLTVPGISQIEDGEWGKNWLWSFTERSMELVCEETFPQANTEIEKFGNVLSASAFLYGVGVGEVTEKELDYNDPLYQMLITVKATKEA